MAPFASLARYDEEETITRPLLRPQPWMLRRPELVTDPSIDLEEVTLPRGKHDTLPDLSCDEDWVTTNELPRRVPTGDLTITIPPARSRPSSERPLPLVNVRHKPSLPPIPAFTRPSTPSRPVLPPVPAFTRPIQVGAIPTRIPMPVPPTRDDSVVQVREDLRGWREIDVVPTQPLASPIPLVTYRPRQETVRGIELDSQMRAFVEHPPAIRYAPVPAVSEPAPSSPLSEVSPCTLPAARVAPARREADRRTFRELWGAARNDAWTAFLLLPIAVSIVSIVVLTLTALASKSTAAANPNRRIVSATDAQGALIQFATVSVDGVAKCQVTPCALDLPDGTHWVSVAAPGYESPPARAVAGGKDGPLQIDFVLAADMPVAAPSSVAAAPRAASQPIAAAGREPAAAPPARADTRHAPRAERAVFAPKPVAVQSSRLNINAIPAANVVLDGRPLGRTPQIGIPVAPGSHTVVFINGKQRVVQGTTVAPGRTAVVAARL